METNLCNDRHGERRAPWRGAGLHALLLIAGLLAGTAAEAQRGPVFNRPGRPWPWQQRQRDVYQELVLKYATHRICRTTQEGRCLEWDTVKLRSYNGRLVGPTIEVRPGDTLNVLLDNQLPTLEPRPHQDHKHNVPHGFNTTNLHTHGLHVSPSGNSDNVLISIPPGEKFHYEIKIPRDHPAGTFWYHPHKHGSATVQIGSGLAGPLIVRGDIDEVPAIQAAREHIFVFQQIAYVLSDDPYHPGEQAYMIEDFNASFGGQHKWLELGRRTTLNGEVEPTLRMRPGEVQRWRFIHAGIQEPIRPKLVRASDPQAVVDQHLIALDGLTTGRVDTVQETELYPGYRADVMIRAGDTQDTYLLVDEEFSDPDDPRRVLARVVVKGRHVDMELPTEEDLAPLAPFEPITDAEVDSQRELRFSLDMSVFPPRFLINGKEFDPNAPPMQLELGKTEEWTIKSLSRGGGHPFHIHVNPFQVLTDDGKVVWKDTIFVPPSGEVKIRTRYQRYIGQFVLHCHFIDHEDLGMMQKVEILPPGQKAQGDHGDHNGLTRRR